MKLLNASQLAEVDSFTIINTPIKSVDLMERAGESVCNWIFESFSSGFSLSIFCGIGNNGGDGLVAARLLHQRKIDIEVFICGDIAQGTPDFKTNLKRLQTLGVSPVILQSKEDLSLCAPRGTLVIDALFGIGLSRPISGWISHVVQKINKLNAQVIAIDMPSGLDVLGHISEESVKVKAHHTLSFEVPKRAFFLPQHMLYVGTFHLLNIGWSREKIEDLPTKNWYVNREMAQKIYQPRLKNAYKNVMGHALLIVGSKSMMGAAAISTRATMKSGAGLVTTLVPNKFRSVITLNCPEVMTLGSWKEVDLRKFKVVGIGCGWNYSPKNYKIFTDLCQNFKKPIVVDATALKMLAQRPDLVPQLPENSVLTPHIGEWNGLIGHEQAAKDRIQSAIEFAQKNKVILVIKGAHTMVVSPLGDVYFNSTGNAGMASAGMGDALTGIITGLIAQGYTALNATILGVYLHGLAADLALKCQSVESLLATDVIDSLGKAFSTCV